MDSQETTNQKIAAILGWEIVPKHKENSGTFVAGKTYLLGHRDAAGRLRITHPERRSRDWSPATDPADALAALEAWCDANDSTARLYFNTSDVPLRWDCHVDDSHSQKPTLCHSVCTAIILAAEAAHG